MYLRLSLQITTVKQTLIAFHHLLQALLHLPLSLSLSLPDTLVFRTIFQSPLTVSLTLKGERELIREQEKEMEIHWKRMYIYISQKVHLPFHR